MGVRSAWKSLFQIHNETLNVWTHLAGAVVFIGLIVRFAVVLQPGGVPSAPVVADTNINSTVPQLGPESMLLPLLSQPLVANGVHTPRMFTMSMLGAPDDLAAAASSYRRAHSLLGGLHSSLHSAWTYVQTATNSIGKGGAALGQHLSGGVIAGALKDAKTLLEKQGDSLRAHSAHAWQLAAARFAEIHESLATATAALNEQVLTTESELVASLREELLVVTAKLSQSAEAARTSLVHLAAARPAWLATDADADSAEGPVPRWPVFLFLGTAVLCLVCSSAFHLFYILSPRMSDLLQQVDLSGISFLVAGSTIPILYYGFYCMPVWQAVYLAMCVLANGASLAVVLLPKYSGIEYGSLRVFCFAAAGFSGTIPGAHLVAVYGLHNPAISTWLWNLLAMGALYLIGAAFYITKFPESRFPGRFDLVLSSHQIWHLFVLTAAVVHYFGVIRQLEYRDGHPCPAA